jgi:hypothetical protein
MVTLTPSVDVDLTLANSHSALTNTNFLQPNSFKLTINRKNFPNLEFFCQSFLHPDVTTTAAEVPFQRITNLPFPPDKITYGELTCMIILDEEMNSYTEINNWMLRLIQTNSRSAMSTARGVDFDQTPPTYADITLSILNSTNNLSRQVRYIDCLPTSLGNISFESIASGDQYITYPASFRFSYFEFK